MNTLFENRVQAGQALGQRLQALRLPGPLLVLALPRGGVPVAAEVARALQAPLDLLLVRKIGLPWQPELAVAAIVEGTPGSTPYDLVLEEEVARSCTLAPDYIERQARLQLLEIERRRKVYLAGRQPLPVAGFTVIVVDDGIATGTTVRAALKALRKRKPARLVLAVPVAPPDTVMALQDEVDLLVCLSQPADFQAIGEHYRDFHQLSDDEVLAALHDADRRSQESACDPP